MYVHIRIRRDVGRNKVTCSHVMTYARFNLFYVCVVLFFSCDLSHYLETLVLTNRDVKGCVMKAPPPSILIGSEYMYPKVGSIKR